MTTLEASILRSYVSSLRIPLNFWTSVHGQDGKNAKYPWTFSRLCVLYRRVHATGAFLRDLDSSRGVEPREDEVKWVIQMCTPEKQLFNGECVNGDLQLEGVALHKASVRPSALIHHHKYIDFHKSRVALHHQKSFMSTSVFVCTHHFARMLSYSPKTVWQTK